MRQRFYYIIIAFIILISCNSINDQYDNDVKNILNVFLKVSISNFKSHNICCQFLFDLSNHDFMNILLLIKEKGKIDSTNDLKELLKIYTKNKGKIIMPYIDNYNYRYIKNLNLYNKYLFYQFHFIFSYPILYNNNNNCFIYTLGLLPKEHSGGQTIFFFKKINGKWIDDFNVKVKNELPPLKHQDKGALVLVKWLQKQD